MVLLSDEEEARWILDLNGGGEQALRPCLDLLANQIGVIQARTQMLLALATITLTITGFSGPKIAEANLFSRYSMSAGLVLVLLSILFLLLGSLQIRWLTQYREDGFEATLRAAIAYRNKKSKKYRIQLITLALGLASYVASVVAFLVY